MRVSGKSEQIQTTQGQVEYDLQSDQFTFDQAVQGLNDQPVLTDVIA